MRRALDFPAETVAHLEVAAAPDELTVMADLERAGMRVGVLALPAAVEDSFYRYNNLPAQLAALYRNVDPLDPDEDLLEEAEPAASALIDQAYLLDEVIDAIYQALRSLPAELVVRRANGAAGMQTGIQGGVQAGIQGGVQAGNGRHVLLALKRLFRHDWETDTVLERLTTGAGIGIEARPVLIHSARLGQSDVPASAEASRLLQRRVTVTLDDSGGLVCVDERPPATG